MRTGTLSKKLGVSTQSIRRWTERFNEFFSEESQRLKSYQANYTDEDVLLLSTIHYLSTQNVGLDDIEKRLRSGYRLSENTITNIYNAHNIVSLEQAEKLLEEHKTMQIEIQKIRMERDYALNQIYKLEEKNKEQGQQLETLIRENATLQYRLGVLEGELNLLRRQAGEKSVT